MLLEKFRTKKEIEPHPLSLEELASELGFEQDLTLKGIEYFILRTKRTEAGMVELFKGYTLNAQIMLEKKEVERQEKRTDKDSLALMLKLAHLRYQTGRYRQLFDDFEDIRLSFYSPDIEPAVAGRVEKTIEAVVKEIAEQKKPSV